MPLEARFSPQRSKTQASPQSTTSFGAFAGLYRGVDVDPDVGLLHAENIVIVTNVRSKVTDNLIVGRPNRRSVGLPVLAKSAPVDAVNVNKTFVVDGQLEVVRHELTGLSRSG